MRPMTMEPRQLQTVRPKRLIWRTIDITDGLPGSVLCIHQDRRGYVWFGTADGLCRYDGVEFLTYTPQDGLAVNLEDLLVYFSELRIHEDSHGRLWFYRPETPTAEGISCLVYPEERQGGKPFIQTYTTKDGLPPGGVVDLAEDNHGRLWFSTMHGATVFDGERFTSYTIDDPSGSGRCRWIQSDTRGRVFLGTLKGIWIFDGQGFTKLTTETVSWTNWPRDPLFHSDRQGRLWAATTESLLVFDGPKSTRLTTVDGLAGNRLTAIHEDDQGRLWFGSESGVTCYSDGEISTMTIADGLAGNLVRGIRSDRCGRVWIWGSGISMFDGEGFTIYTTADGLAQNGPGNGSVYTDRHGKVWFSFGNGGGGVSVFDGEGFTPYTVADGLLTSRVTHVWEDGSGYLWLMHPHSGLTLIHPETLELLTDKPAVFRSLQLREDTLWFLSENDLCCLSSGQLHCWTFDWLPTTLLIDTQGALWIGGSQGIHYYETPSAVWEGEGRWFTTANGLGGDEVWSLLETHDGTIWAAAICRPASQNYLCRYDGNGAFEAVPMPCGGLMECLMEDRHGRIWFGGWMGGGLSCYDGKEITTYTMEDGLPNDTIRSLLEDEAGRIWIGTLQGLCCFDGQHFIHYGESHLLKDLVYNQASAMDSNGQLWFSTSVGVYRYNGRHFQQLTIEDGLPANQVWGLMPQSDGTMLIETAQGVVRYQLITTNPPPIEIREVVADQVYRHPTTLELTSSQGRGNRLPLLTISYYAMGFTTRRMRYSYILAGHDENWQDTWERSVHYEDLPVGEYTFKVIAISRDLVESETPATLKLKVVPDPRDLLVSELQSRLSARDRQLAYLQQEMGRRYQFENIIGKSNVIEWVRAMMDRAIDSGLNVLVTGETGTGKELVAKGIHYNSSRRDRPPVPMNCAAVQKDLIGTELFGHRKGAFTGAIEDKPGLFEVADGSTLLLDEIGDMPPDVQANLLRVLEERKVQRLGEHRLRDVDVRVISMTNRDLQKAMQEGSFREDLYYRLNGFHIHVPPLRNRPEDIPLLAERFYHQTCEELGVALDGFVPGVIDMLQNYPWPGNVRELRHAIHRACVLAEPEHPIQPHHFLPETPATDLPVEAVLSAELGYSESLNALRRLLVERALRQTGGNRTQAAKQLGMETRNLRRLIRRLEIEDM